MLVLAVVPVALLVLGLVGGGVVVGAVVVTIVKVDDVVPRFFVFGGLTVTTPCGAVRCGAMRFVSVRVCLVVYPTCDSQVPAHDTPAGAR